MPQLGETVTEGTVIRWLKKVGDSVTVDEPLLEVSTDKVDTEIPSPTSGLLDAILVSEDTTVPVGAVLARVVPPPLAERPTLTTASHLAAPARKRHEQSPLVRRLAAEHGVDLLALHGTGPSGRISRADVLAAAASPRVATPAAAVGPRYRADGVHDVPQAATIVEVDVTELARHVRRAELAATLLPFFVRAAVEALALHPTLNATKASTGMTPTRHRKVDLGIVLDGSGARSVTLITAADDLSLAGLTRRITDLSGPAGREGLATGELDEATFTVTDSGACGTLFDIPALRPPQVAAMGIGSVTRRAVVVDDDLGSVSFAARYISYVSLHYDHQAVDGAEASSFLATLRSRLEGPDG